MKKNLILIFLFCFVVIGCAAGRIQIIEPAKSGIKNYPVLEILDFENYAGSATPSEMAQRLPNGIEKKLSPLNLFEAVNRVPVLTEAKPDEKTLVLKGNIIEYNPGSRGKRYLAGFTGWGKGFITVQLTAIDKATKEEIFKGNISGELAGGLFGGGFDGAIEKLVDESVKYIQMNY